jgi:hypothetical protein
MQIIIHVSQARQEDIGQHRFGTGPRIHHTPREIMNLLWIWEVRAKRMEFIAKGLDALLVKRAGRDCEVVATLA